MEKEQEKGGEQPVHVDIFTQEDIDRDYVKKSQYDDLAKKYSTLVDGFNKLAAEYNELHIKSLLPGLVSK